jgi:hypothetical protein
MLLLLVDRGQSAIRIEASKSASALTDSAGAVVKNDEF